MTADNFLQERVHRLPRLGIGVSTEFGAFRQRNNLDIKTLLTSHPGYAGFLEIGVELSKGLDEDSLDWIAEKRPTTYHFLDLNLGAREPLEKDLLLSVKKIAEQMEAAWVCGDAGLWYFGRRHPLQMTLLPPILCEEEAAAYAANLKRCRSIIGKEVLPENPPGSAFVGTMDLLSFYASICEQADTGMLLDAAHLSIYQTMMGRKPLDGLSDFPLERIVEIHVAGSRRQIVDGLEVWVDDHFPEVRSETWEIASYLAHRTPNLKAVVFECERNPIASCLTGFGRIQEIFGERWS